MAKDATVEAASLHSADDEGASVIAAVRDRIQDRYRSENEQIIHLLQWYGSGRLHSYLCPEFILTRCLTQIPLTAIAAALTDAMRRACVVHRDSSQLTTRTSAPMSCQPCQRIYCSI
jgi:hypothetical protein